MKNISQIEEMARIMRKKALDLAFHSGKNGSHLGGGLSAIEIFASLYGGILNIDAKCPDNPTRDRLVVSKGHCVLAYYTALWQSGFITEEDLMSFETNGSRFVAHAKRDKTKGIEFTGGSLGLGVSFAVGVALACKAKSLPSHVYILLGDGECNEGIVWEAIMAASNYKLTNFTVIIDSNGLQSDGKVIDVLNVGSLIEKFKSFGFATYEVDGHNILQLINALKIEVVNVPKVIVAHTIKGKGVSFMENNPIWHHGILSEKQYEQAMMELKKINL